MANVADLNLIQINNFPEVTNPSEWIVVSDAAGIGYKISKENFKAFLGTVTVSTPKPIGPTDVTPELDGVYIPTVVGVYPNFGGLERLESDGYVQFIKNGAVYAKVNTPMPLPDLSGLATKEEAQAVPQLLDNSILIEEPGTNVFNKENAIVAQERYSPASGIQTSVSANYATTGFLKLKPSTDYAISGTKIGASGTGIPAGGAYDSDKLTRLSLLVFTATPGGHKFTTPENIEYAYINLVSNGEFSALDNIQIQEGSVVTPYEPFGAEVLINNDKFRDQVVSSEEFDPIAETTLENADFLSENFATQPKSNWFDKDSMIEEGKSWSLLSSKVSGNANYIMARVRLQSGKQYTISGANQVTTISGGVLDSFGGETGSTIAFTTLATGKTFVLEGNGEEREVAINMASNTASWDAVKDTFQITQTDIVVPYEPYELVAVYKGIVENSGGGSIPIGGSQYPSPVYDFNLPKFRDIFLNKTKDVVIAMEGTSLLRNNYTTERTDKEFRFPLGNTNNVASAIYDKIAETWSDQQYRRYDSGLFTEIGTFTETTSLPEWDDNTSRIGHTKYSNTSDCSIAFEVAQEAYQFNFIYRTDLEATTVNRVSVAQGNDYMQVFNGSAWVEANGYEFSMRESAVTATKGNTTYQKRLKMRCKGGVVDSIGVAKNMTITNISNDGRFMYWGVEWSPREFMCTLINASRGGHNWGTAVPDLMKFQDNELYSFNPDLIIFELTLINYGASNSTHISTRLPSHYTNIIEDKVFNMSNPISLASKTNNLEDIEVIFFLDTPGILSNAYDSAGKLTWVQNPSGQYQTVLDNWDAVEAQFLSKDLNYSSVYRHFKQFAEKTYGSLYEAMQGSGNTGNTLSPDGTHWNLNGNIVVSSILVPVLDLVK